LGYILWIHRNLLRDIDITTAMALERRGNWSVPTTKGLRRGVIQRRGKRKDIATISRRGQSVLTVRRGMYRHRDVGWGLLIVLRRGWG